MSSIRGCLPSPIKICDAVGLTERSSSNAKKGLLITSVSLIVIGTIALVAQNYIPKTTIKIGLLGAGIPLTVVGMGLISTRIFFNSSQKRNSSEVATRSLQDAINTQAADRDLPANDLESLLRASFDLVIVRRNPNLQPQLLQRANQGLNLQEWISSRASILDRSEMQLAVAQRILLPVAVELYQNFQRQNVGAQNDQDLANAILATAREQADARAREIAELANEMKKHLDHQFAHQTWEIKDDLKYNENDYKCAISQDLLKDLAEPCFFAEDGHTYELESIKQQMLYNPGRSPNRQDTTPLTQTPTLVRYASKDFVNCPITKKPFVQAYFCIEDGFTYELEALKEYIREKRNDSDFIPSPGNPAVNLKKITVYPNIALTEGKVPEAVGGQKPLVLFGS